MNGEDNNEETMEVADDNVAEAIRMRDPDWNLMINHLISNFTTSNSSDEEDISPNRIPSIDMQEELDTFDGQLRENSIKKLGCN
ncbi:hypothetical protein Ciccas_008822 [Cichlidogyrus casuarinus]|uniref:Uncharacterized protein n=1 Tax=Cichlidogyrus casuarinus TaxID=1844966 RepID=A0ABD2PYY2_9PLAT